MKISLRFLLLYLIASGIGLDAKPETAILPTSTVQQIQNLPQVESPKFTDENTIPISVSLPPPTKEKDGSYPFLPNQGQVRLPNGQISHNVLFHSRLTGVDAYFSADRVSLIFQRKRDPRDGDLDPPKMTEADHLDRLPATREVHRIDLTFLNSNPKAAPAGTDQGGPVTRYYFPDQIDGKSAQSYRKITYKHLWHGIDLQFYATDFGTLKYDFIVHSGANPKDIRLAYRGADSVDFEPDGNIRVKARFAEFVEPAPISFQNAKSIETTYESFGNGVFGFKLGDYDQSQTLVIDPQIQDVWVIEGQRTDGISEGILGSSGHFLTTGVTQSDAFTDVLGYNNAFSSGENSFVAMHHISSQQIAWVSYLGTDNSVSFARRVLASSIGWLPQDKLLLIAGTTSGPLARSHGKFNHSAPPPAARYVTDGFLAALDVNSGELAWSTYFGGNNSDSIEDFITDEHDSIYIVGSTVSDTLPRQIPGRGRLNSSLINGYAAKLSQKRPQPHLPAWSSYTARLKRGQSRAIAASPDGYLVVVGADRGEDSFNAHYPWTGRNWPLYQAYIGLVNPHTGDTMEPVQGSAVLDRSMTWFEDVKLSPDRRMIFVGHCVDRPSISEATYSDLDYDVALAVVDFVSQTIWTEIIGGSLSDHATSVTLQESRAIITGAINGGSLTFHLEQAFPLSSGTALGGTDLLYGAFAIPDLSTDFLMGFGNASGESGSQVVSWPWGENMIFGSMSFARRNEIYLGRLFANSSTREPNGLVIRVDPNSP
ncbi:hypothetical protein [Synoicihabitans lomoniglobus]|uniref:SBBP repeat-containing protein n=1 Tax=Synoicihabitans lomoniglobus TaxID=2909285 RepID=A0AAE9ZYG1_9BACT|nr:SBBP repeat-containing protein [Opitutaceae bacterium LMO-M01]WED65679.1 SBBP repeat-containing protein [Opitutaceae bacterium LMO-M01]